MFTNNKDNDNLANTILELADTVNKISTNYLREYPRKRFGFLSFHHHQPIAEKLRNESTKLSELIYASDNDKDLDQAMIARTTANFIKEVNNLIHHELGSKGTLFDALKNGKGKIFPQSKIAPFELLKKIGQRISTPEKKDPDYKLAEKLNDELNKIVNKVSSKSKPQ